MFGASKSLVSDLAMKRGQRQGNAYQEIAKTRNETLCNAMRMINDAFLHFWLRIEKFFVFFALNHLQNGGITPKRADPMCKNLIVINGSASSVSRWLSPSVACSASARLSAWQRFRAIVRLPLHGPLLVP
jgi:hypothetical protein